MSRRRRIFSELVPLPQLVASPVLERLAEREIQLLVAVQPGQLRPLLELIHRAKALGLSLGIWPLLDDKQGRWLNPRFAHAFEAWTTQLLDVLAADRLHVDTLVLDLEPPIEEVRAVVRGELGAAKAWLSREADAAVHERLVALAASRSIESFAAVVPTVLLEGRASRGFARALGTPIDGIAYDRVSAMVYTTLFEGYGFGVIDRRDARALLGRFARESLERVGSRASLALGAVGKGALGDEQTYRGPEELAEDVAIVRHEGIEDLALFDLSGVLAREPIDPWLDALDAAPQPLPEPMTARALAAITAAYVTGVALSVEWRGRASRPPPEPFTGS
ncbi:MAG: hypothetical protein AB7S26_30875 [Sandaracinaceae bacterium]